MEISNDMSYPTGSPHGLSLKRFMSLRLRVPGEQALGVNRPQEPRVLGHEAVSGRGGSPVGIFLIKSLGIARATPTADRGREDEGKVGSAWKGCLASRPGSLSHIGGPLPLEISWDRDRSRQISSGSPPMET